MRGDILPTDSDEVERYQWMRNKEGGQGYGNLQEIRPLTRPLFDRYVADKVAQELRDYDRYKEAFPALTHLSLVSMDRGKTWQLTVPSIGALDDVRPRPDDPRWVVRVDSFDDRGANEQGLTADSDGGPAVASVAPVTQADVSAAIHALLGEEYADRHPFRINQGECENFAEDVIARLGLNSDGRSGSADCFVQWFDEFFERDDEDEPTAWYAPAIKAFKIRFPEGYSPREFFPLFSANAAHAFVVLTEPDGSKLFFDAEAPGGVANVLDLPVFAALVRACIAPEIVALAREHGWDSENVDRAVEEVLRSCAESHYGGLLLEAERQSDMRMG